MNSSVCNRNDDAVELLIPAMGKQISLEVESLCQCLEKPCGIGDVGVERCGKINRL